MRPNHCWSRDSFRKCQTFRCQWGGVPSCWKNVISWIFAFPEWISTSTMDRSHRECRIDTSVLVTEVSRFQTLWLSPVGIRERCSLRTTSSQEFEWPKKRYHSCGELSDTGHSPSRLGWIQLPSRPRVRNSRYWGETLQVPHPLLWRNEASLLLQWRTMYLPLAL